MHLPSTKGRLGLAAGLVGGAVGLAIVSGFGPAPALSSIGSQGDDDSTSSTVATSTTLPATTAAVPAGAPTRTLDAGAGTVVFAESGGQLSLVSATPAPGWAVEVEQAAGRDVEVDFRQGNTRVQVNVEFEDGAVRERIRVRDDDAGTEVRIENGVVVRTEGFGDDTGSSGPGSSGSDSSGSGSSDTSGSDDSGGHGDDDDGSDDHGFDDNGGDRDDGAGDDSSGRGGDDVPGDDHGGDD